MATGIKVDQVLKLGLRSLGCELHESSVDDHGFKVDFTLRKIYPIPYELGLQVQITTWWENPRKISDFERASRGTTEGKRLYLEVPADLDAYFLGVPQVVVAGMIQFCFDRAYAEEEIMVLRVQTDASYEFLSIPEKEEGQEDAEEARESGEVKEWSIPKTAAVVEPYFPKTGKRFGFVETGEGERYYFKFDDVTDATLKRKLQVYRAGDKTPVWIEGVVRSYQESTPRVYQIYYRDVG